MLRPSNVAQALKAQKVLVAREHARICFLKHNFHKWKQCHATLLKDHSDKVLLALQFMTGQSLGRAAASVDNS